MNTASEIKLNENSERSSGERRRGMALVIPGKRSDTKKRFTISIEEKMFSRVDGPPRIQSWLESRAADPSSESTSGTTHQCDDSGRKLLALTAVIGVVGAVILGYFVGRARD